MGLEKGGVKMNIRDGWLGTLCLMGAIIAVLPAEPTLAQTPSSREQLRQHVAQLQNDPNNADLREKIIKLALTIKPSPAISDEVREDEGAGEWAFKHAQSKDDFANAAKQYENALLVAPWIAGDYFNLALCEEKAEQYDRAIANYNLYLLAAPDAKDRDDVLTKIGGLRYAIENPPTTSAQTISTPIPPPPPKELEGDDLIASLDGSKYEHQYTKDGIVVTQWLLIIGHQVQYASSQQVAGRVTQTFNYTYQIEGTKFHWLFGPTGCVDTIASDAITEDCVENVPPNPVTYQTVYRRVRP